MTCKHCLRVSLNRFSVEDIQTLIAFGWFGCSLDKIEGMNDFTEVESNSNAINPWWILSLALYGKKGTRKIRGKPLLFPSP